MLGRTLKGKWAQELSAYEVIRSYELGWQLTDCTNGLLDLDDSQLYHTLHELTTIVVKSRLDPDHAWFEDIVQDTVTTILVERGLKRYRRSWRHLLSVLTRKPLEALELEEEKLHHFALFGADLGAVQDRGGLRLSSSRISYLLSTAQLYFVADMVRDKDPSLGRYLDHVLIEVTQRRPRWAEMVKAYKVLAGSTSKLRRLEIVPNAA